MLRVTHCLSAAGLVDPTWFTEESSARGTAVHEATALDDVNDLDEASVHPIVAPYLESYRRWRKESGWKLWEGHIEVEVIHEPLGYVGHIDRIMRRPVGPAMRPVVIDLKTTAGPSMSHPIQTSGYHMAWQHMTGFPDLIDRGCVYLQADGSAGKWVAHTDRRDFEVWKAVLTVAKFKESKA